jgi:hypothetical protein
MIAAIGAHVDGKAGFDVVPTPADSSTTALLELVRSTLAEGEALLLVRDGGDGVVQRAADVAAAALRDEGVVVRTVRAPATRFAALATVLDEFGQWLPVGALVPAIPLVEAALSTVALVDSVAQLEHPAPSVVDHAASHLPGSRFLILPDRVVRGGRAQLTSTPATGPGRGFVAASRDPTAQEWRRELVDAAGCQRVVTVWDRLPSWWRARRWAELTTVTEATGRLLDRLAAALPVAACRWCGRHGAVTAACCFCGAGTGPGPAGSGPAGSGPAGGPARHGYPGGRG